VIDLSDPLPDMGVQVRDSSGALAAAGLVAVTLTYPDGSGGVVTRTSPADLAVTSPSVGVYRSAWQAVALGEHRARWVATGANASAHEQSWLVGDVEHIVSLAAVRRYLGVSRPDAEDELRDMLSAVSEVCERHTRRRWRRRVVTSETHELARTCSVWLRQTPVTSVTSVQIDGVTLPATSWSVEPRSGELTILGAGPSSPGSAPRIVSTSYVSGPRDGRIPPHIVQGCKLLAGHMWETQRGGSNMPRRSGAEDEINPVLSFVPPRVRQAWGQPRVLCR
jgi:hypothetical protein